ncbi:MAG: 2Fe-2S iron-sulfur cluster-binding protein [Zoogloea sp.]|uniref:2Fe-2S iron-sulfur cluster-binding protein n=1 Tax=Zoogloea sp. TaxID=49181 RepID=UPI003F39FF1C
MPQVTFIEPSGNEVQIDVANGWSLMQAATSNGVEGMEAECGGSCACATCHCYVESHADQVPAAAANEEEMLANVAAERRPNSRLACQIKMSDELAGIVVRLPEVQY